MNAVRAYAYVVLSGMLLALSFPPVGYGFIAWFALVPLVAVAERCSFGRTLWLGWIGGLVFLGATLNWMRHITWVGMVLAVLVLALFFAVPFAVYAFVNRAGLRHAFLVLPLVTAAVEWLRSFDQLAFPWMILGNSQTAYPWLIQFADITSAFGVSAWVVLVNVLLFRALQYRSVQWAGASAGVFAAAVLYSVAQLATADTDGAASLTASLVQGNVTPAEKWGAGREEWNIDLYTSLSRDAVQSSSPDIIIWPETAIPEYIVDIPVYRRRIQSFVDSLDVPLLSGVPSIEFDSGKTFNSAALFVPLADSVQRYHKIHLVPFGEAFPMDQVFPALRRIDFGQANWHEGRERVVFQPETVPPFNVAVCFESIFPDLIRRFIRRGSQFIVVITNDVWFGPFASPQQHAMISVMRAVEFNRPVLRCANSGISMIIDAEGRITARTGTFERTVLTGECTPRTKMTPYARFGNIFSMVSVVLTGGYVFAAVRARRRTGRPDIL